MFDNIDKKFRAPPASAFDRIDEMFNKAKISLEIDPTTLESGMACPFPSCTGKFVDNHHGEDGGCSCHLRPPCNWCVDTTIICNVCDYEPWDRP